MKKTTNEIEHAIENRKSGKELAIDAAIKGDPISGALFALESIAQSNGLGFLATTAIDYSEEDDDIRPF